MNVSREPALPRRRALRWIGMVVFVLASGCGGHGDQGAGGGGSSAPAGDWDQLVWDQSNWS